MIELISIIYKEKVTIYTKMIVCIARRDQCTQISTLDGRYIDVMESYEEVLKMIREFDPVYNLLNK